MKKLLMRLDGAMDKWQPTKGRSSVYRSVILFFLLMNISIIIYSLILSLNS